MSRLSLFRAAVLIVISAVSAPSESAFQREYTISMGTPSEKVPSGSVWLYSFSWYGLLKVQLGSIHNGSALLLFDTEKLKRALDPNPETEAFVVVIQLSENEWLRSSDTSRDTIWSTLPSVVNSLGRATTEASGEVQLVRW